MLGRIDKSYAVRFDKKLLLNDSDSGDSVAIIQKKQIIKEV